MIRLTALLFVIIGASVAGIFIVAALVMGLDTAQPILWSAILGFVLAVPVSYLIARQLA